MDGLLGGAALPVDGGGGHGIGESGAQPGVAGGVHGLLADLVDGAPDHVVDEGGIDAAALDQGAQGVGEQGDRVDMGQGSARLALSYRGPDGFDDDGVAHDWLLSWISGPTRIGNIAQWVGFSNLLREVSSFSQPTRGALSYS